MLRSCFHPRCSTCQKARQWLDERSLGYNEIDITATAPSVQELRQALGAYSGDVRKLFNTSGMQYREGGYKEKLPQMDPEDALALLSREGMLVKRPFLIGKNARGEPVALAGFREAIWQKTLLG